MHYHSQIFPLFYVLMSNKTTECYKAVFEYISQHIFDMQPTEIITDFEGGLRKAIRLVFQSVILRGCYFHYKKAIRLKCEKSNLKKLFAENQHAANIRLKLMNLPLTPMHQTKTAYDLIVKQAKKFGVDKALKPLFTYFNRFWVVKVIYYCLILFCVKN